MLLSPNLHGTFGTWDELIFAAAFIIAILIFIALALHDRKRDPKEDSKPNEDDN
jgi:hypothetical protein